MSLKHPIRRKILRMLSGRAQSFSEMQEVLRLESSHLTYHLESLGSLLFKTEDGKYALSSLGEAAVSMMCHVEEPPKTVLHLPLPSRRWKILLATLMVGIILLSSLCYFQYQTLTQLSGQYLSLKQEHELLQDVLREVLGLGNAALTYEYMENSTVATALVTITNETTNNITFAINIVSPLGCNITWVSITSPWGRSSDSYSIYSLTSNSTLEIEISFPSPDQPGAYLSVWVSKEIRVPYGWNASVIVNRALEWYNFSELIAYELVWGTRVTNSSTCSVLLPSRGWYFIQIGVPSVWNATDHYIINYTVTFRTKSQRNYIPFFVGGRIGGFGPMEFFGMYDFGRSVFGRKDDP